MTDEELQREVELWDLVNEYAAACGGDTGDRTVSDRRIRAVAAIGGHLWADRSRVYAEGHTQGRREGIEEAADALEERARKFHAYSQRAGLKGMDTEAYHLRQEAVASDEHAEWVRSLLGSDTGEPPQGSEEGGGG